MHPSNPLNLKAWRDSAIRAVALALLPCAFANAGKIEPGHSAMWINPDRNGEGWILELLPNDGAALYWYTSDDEGKPRWIISNGGGSIVRGEDGDKIVFSELVTGHGGRFAQNVPASDVTLEVVGTAEMRFSDCNTGEISFDAYGKAATYPLTRLTHTMATGCLPFGSISAQPPQPHAGTSGTWYDVESNGGPVFTLQWQPDGQAILFWFAYDPEGRPFWAAGLGNYENELLTFPELHSISGGRFSEDYPDEQTVEVPWGSLELYFTCDEATASYNAAAEGFGFGTFHLKPLTRLVKPACPYVKPKLSDFYDIELVELPEEPGSPYSDFPGNNNLIFPDSVSDTGAVVGRRRVVIDSGAGMQIRYRPARWEPGLLAWEIPFDNYVAYDSIAISPDGNELLFGSPDPLNPFTRITPSIFRGSGIETLSGLTFGATNKITSVSRDLAQVVGTYLVPHPAGGQMEAAWTWTAETGQVDLPFSDENGIPQGIPVAASNDGRTVIGTQYAFIEDPWFPEIPQMGGGFAVRWIDRQPPQRLSGKNGEYLGNASACSANCEIVFGNNSWARFDDMLRDASFEAWYWKPDGETGSLGAPNNNTHYTRSNPNGWSFHLSAASADGNFLVGTYYSWEMDINSENPVGPWPSSGGLIWNNEVGYVVVSDLLEEIGHPLDWYSMGAIDVSPSGNYILLTSYEVFEGGAATGTPITSSSRSALLRLTPKQD